MKYENLLFDVDDTLLDFKAAELAGLTKLFANHGYTLTDKLLVKYQMTTKKTGEPEKRYWILVLDYFLIS